MTTLRPDDDAPAGVALVTGATSGLGRAIALRLAVDRFEVVVHGRDVRRGREVVNEIEQAGGRARFEAAELTVPAEIERLAGAVADIDVLVNTAGFSWFGPTADLDVDTFDSLYASNVRAPYLLVAAVAPRMATRGHGSIVNIGSMSGQIGLSGGAAYGATKAALAALTRAWAAEFSPRGVRVNTISPGPVYTEGASPDRTEALGRSTLLGRAANPGEIAEVVSYLASTSSGYVTGSLIAIDGGRTAV
jgi:NAD(P)-dependent dehydrogenase (short-subunit alcohol dehydrogenase family)